MTFFKNKKLIIILFIFLFTAVILKIALRREPAIPPVRPKKVIDTLFVGDATLNSSFGASFINEILESKNLQRTQIETYTIPRSTFSKWLEGIAAHPSHSVKYKLFDLLRETEPRRVVLSLGTEDFLISAKTDNKDEATSRALVAQIQMRLKNIFAQFNRTQCFWIGPSLNASSEISLEKQNRLYNELKYAVTSANCIYLDPREVPAIDFTHSKKLSLSSCAAKKNQKPVHLDDKESILITDRKNEFWGFCLAHRLK